MMDIPLPLKITHSSSEDHWSSYRLHVAPRFVVSRPLPQWWWCYGKEFGGGNDDCAREGTCPAISLEG